MWRRARHSAMWYTQMMSRQPRGRVADPAPRVGQQVQQPTSGLSDHSLVFSCTLLVEGLHNRPGRGGVNQTWAYRHLQRTATQQKVKRHSGSTFRLPHAGPPAMQTPASDCMLSTVGLGPAGHC